MDELLKEYAGILQRMYDERTVGDCSFVGILSEFAEHVRATDSVADKWRSRDRFYPALPGDPINF